MKPGTVGNSFPKSERLCSKLLIEKLFATGKTLVAGPVIAYYLVHAGSAEPGVRVLFAVPKKKIRKAVDRNRVKRLMREAYRTHKQTLLQKMVGSKRGLLLALVYTSKNIPEFQEVDRIIFLILQRLTNVHEETAG